VNFTDYQEAAKTTAAYPPEIGLAYVTLGLAGEAGEIANKVKKVYRDKDGKLDGATASALVGELGDVLWYCAALATELGVPLEDVASYNITKLAVRAEHGTIHGDGDNR
jgi:NTP pyrophosphatase (non-canonical NTP hydrolase)